MALRRSACTRLAAFKLLKNLLAVDEFAASGLPEPDGDLSANFLKPGLSDHVALFKQP